MASEEEVAWVAKDIYRAGGYLFEWASGGWWCPGRKEEKTLDTRNRGVIYFWMEFNSGTIASKDRGSRRKWRLPHGGRPVTPSLRAL